MLKKEIKKGIEETEQSKKYLKAINCNHEVRLNYYGDYCSHSVCVFCNKTIAGDNVVNWSLPRNRNKYFVMFPAKEQDDYIIEGGYTKEDVYNIILKILSTKTEDEEIDLVQEFQKLNLDKCSINTERKIDENFILIIGGSNRQYIDEETYITKSSVVHTYYNLNVLGVREKDIISLNILSYFSGLLNTKVELLENHEIYQSKQFQENFSDKDQNLNFKSYNTIEELKDELEKQTKISFKFIIDVSDLYEYKVDNNIIRKESVYLPLEAYFPNSKIIRISDLQQKSAEDDKVFSLNLKNTCDKLKIMMSKNH